jgi:hypothetical protein
MSILTLDAGGLDLDVPCERAGHADPREVGERRYTSNGNERSFIKAELMNVPVVISNIQEDTARLIREMFANGNQVPCTGVVFNNALAEVICSGEITDEAETGGAEGEPLYWVVSLTLAEARNAGTGLGL